MRSHRQVLRQISEQNLNPKIAYVKGKNGVLVPKKTLNVPSVEKTENSQEVTTISLEETVVESLPEDPKPEIQEATEEKSKKKVPPKKKKSETLTDE